jgi:hypothetical protein
LPVQQNLAWYRANTGDQYSPQASGKWTHLFFLLSLSPSPSLDVFDRKMNFPLLIFVFLSIYMNRCIYFPSSGERYRYLESSKS